VTITDPHTRKKSGAFGAVEAPRGEEGRKGKRKEKEEEGKKIAGALRRTVP
jgi:hypothetical protein